jgi:multiple sugar transport system permease protein
MTRERRTVAAVRYVVLVLLAVLFLLPFYVLLRNAFATSAELAAPRWVWLPADPSLDNLRRLFANDNVQLARSLLNSFVVATVQTAATVVISAMAA